MASQPCPSALKMETLLLSEDTRTVETLFPLLRSTGLHAEVCSDSDLAVEMLARWKFDAVIVDCDEIPKGLSVLQALRAAPSNKAAAAFALVSHTSVGTAFRMGATFVLTKPIIRERARSAFQAAFGLMLLGRRRYHRRPISVPARFVRSSGEELKLLTVNISEGGACVSGSVLPEPDDQGKFIFRLPDAAAPTIAGAEAMWASPTEAGLRFNHIANGGIHSLREWISESFAREVAFRPPVEALRS